MTKWLHTALRRALFLAGTGAVFVFAHPAPGGQPIKFSSPNKGADVPSEKEIKVDLPRPTLKFDFGRPGDGELPRPVMPIDPRVEKMLREKQQDRLNWLEKEPELFRDKLADPFKETKPTGAEPFKSWDSSVERVLGRQAPVDNSAMGLSPSGNAMFSDNPLFNPNNRTVKPSESISGGLEGLRSANTESVPNSSEAAMRALFRPRTSEDTVPIMPGMSLSEMMNAATHNAAKRERENSHQEFNRMLTPPAPNSSLPAAGGLYGPGDDQTRSVFNPVTPLGSPLLAKPEEPTKNPLEPIAPLNPTEKLLRDRYPVEQKMHYFQPQKPPEEVPVNKNNQLQQLRLNSTPSILSIPSRRF